MRQLSVSVSCYPFSLTRFRGRWKQTLTTIPKQENKHAVIRFVLSQQDAVFMCIIFSFLFISFELAKWSWLVTIHKVLGLPESAHDKCHHKGHTAGLPSALLHITSLVAQPTPTKQTPTENIFYERSTLAVRWRNVCLLSLSFPSSGKNCSPAPDLVLWEPSSTGISSPKECLFHGHRHPEKTHGRLNDMIATWFPNIWGGSISYIFLVQCRKPRRRLTGAGSGRVYNSPRLAHFGRVTRSDSRHSESLEITFKNNSTTITVLHYISLH